MTTFIGQNKQINKEHKQEKQETPEPGEENNDGLPSLPAGEEMSLVLIGKTGQGKSETANTLCGKQFFDASDSASSVTVKNKSIKVKIGGRALKIVDTPGCMDTKKGNAVIKDIADAITTAPDGYDAFLIVVKYPVRLTAEERDAIKQLEKLFGKEMYDYSLIVFTHGDCFKLKQENSKTPMTFEEYIQQDWHAGGEDSMGTLLKKVSGRAVLFSNFEKDPLEKRKMIINLAEQVGGIRQKMGRRYDNKLFEKAREFQAKSGDAEQRSYWLYEYMLKILNLKSWCLVM